MLKKSDDFLATRAKPESEKPYKPSAKKLWVEIKNNASMLKDGSLRILPQDAQRYNDYFKEVKP